MTNTPNFRRNTGRLATDRLDFEKHLQGTNPGADSSFVTGFRHKASHVDIDNPSLVYGTPATVEAALENIKTFIGTLSNAGQGFVTVGDGYNAWHAADGSINFDPAIPTLDTLLIPIFNAIANADGYNIPEAFQRIKYGGVIVIKAGTYVIANTIEVPPGIVIMGEGYGTKLVNITSLTIPAIGIEPTPKGTPTPLPLFKILPDLARTPNDSSVDPNRFMFSRSTKFVNLVICDNFVENPILGGNYYKLPQNKSGNIPLIKQAEGSNLELINVYMLGRVNFTSGTIVNEATRFAIQLDTTSALGTGTVLKISDSFIDGFSQPIQFSSVGGTNDYLEINNSKIRSHGYLDANGTAVSKNCVISMNDNNAILTNNYFYGNHSLCTTIAYIDAVITAPVLQSISKILIASNDFAINKTTSSSITPTVVSLNSGITTTILTRATVLAYGNTFQNTIGFQIEDSTGSLLSVNSSRVYIPISVKNKTVTITTSTYTVDGTSPDYMLFADTTSTAISITLPVHDAGRKVIIKDIGFNASVNNITLVRAGSTGTIEDYSGSRIIATNGASISLMSNGTNWYIY